VAEHPVVAADRLEVRYRASSGDVLALDGLSFAVPAGQMVAVIGKSGAGKSTLLRCLTGFVKPTSGRLAVDGVEVAGAGGRALRRLRRRVAVVPQSYNLVERATALDNVLFGRLGHIAGWRSLLGLFPRSDVARASSALADLGLAERARQRVDSLSGGERQRVAIARALVQEPALVLADEPAASLDVSLTRLVLDTLTALNCERGVTILVNLHDLALARQYAGRILALRNGRLVFDGAPRELTPAAEQEIYDGAHPEGGARRRARVRLVGAAASPA
jgi:phosphonate transport system ATP-binding protein